ncbi:MAG: hypothetical protein ACOVNL_06400 [Prochlorococcaceae cyanobacterium]|jgi:hypothetical protein
MTSSPTAFLPAALQQGDCIRLSADDPQQYQVIGINQAENRCWLRRWPLARQGCPVFELPLHQLEPGCVTPAPHRPQPFGSRS